ncbi:CC_3452 family protein [Sphingomonas oligophenolica]|uniref:Uncharacterized protein n=1 Tax=Sphingomonas oligophenolica TaxID=301154 RepID=A0A502CSB7_9SPHN|nr:hypothetical protein [Sphingomonas oligophenolica]TPG15622.1 hypothetical protein EAH84_02195 [Sphingomonas oligophenolica]
MKHLVSLGAAILVAGTLVTATAHAQTPTGYYVAVPAAQPDAVHLVTRTAAWRLQGGAYVADQAPERPEILCQLVAGKTGALTSFSVKGKPLDDAKLAKCNNKASGATNHVASNAK